RRLVPWGEYVPGKDLLPFVGKLARHAGDFSPGDDVALIDLAPIGLASRDQGTGGERLGLAVCYEVIFPLPVAEQVRAGATILMSITNDSWYGDSSAPWQHLRAARWRAAENQRPMVRAALTGVSAIIDRRGQVVEALGVDARGSLAFRVVGSSDLTPFSRAPWAPVLIAGLLVGFAIMRVPRRPLTESAPPTASEPNEPVLSDQESS
ncbi:MAG: apolipoprotein N-acyltransferase, partial [Acidobacteriota bacterium]